MRKALFTFNSLWNPVTFAQKLERTVMSSWGQLSQDFTLWLVIESQINFFHFFNRKLMRQSSLLPTAPAMSRFCQTPMPLLRMKSPVLFCLPSGFPLERFGLQCDSINLFDYMDTHASKLTKSTCANDSKPIRLQANLLSLLSDWLKSFTAFVRSPVSSP